MFYLYDNVYHLGVYNPKNLGNDKALFYGACSRFGVYNPKNLGNDKRFELPTADWGVFITSKI